MGNLALVIRSSLFIVLISLITSCGSPSSFSGGESGIGGTGIALVKGNITDLNSVNSTQVSNENSAVIASLKILISDALAQSGSLQGIAVYGGGQSAITNRNGGFVLVDVMPSENFSLVFIVPGGQFPITLEVGEVSLAQVTNVMNIRIDSDADLASFESVEVTENTGSDEDFSAPNIPPSSVVNEDPEVVVEEQVPEQQPDPVVTDSDQQSDSGDEGSDSGSDSGDAGGDSGDSGDNSDDGSGSGGDGAESDPDAGGGGSSDDGAGNNGQVGDSGPDSTL